MTLAVALVMGRFATWETGLDCHPSQARVATILGITTRAVRSHLKWLREAGWLRRVGKVGDGAHGGNDDYRLTIPTCLHRHDGSSLPRVVE